MAINPPDLQYGIRQIATGNEINDGLGDPVRSAFEKINFDLTIIAAQLVSINTALGTNGTSVSSILTRVAALEAETAALESQVAINTADITALQTEVDALQIAVSGLGARTTTAEFNITALQTSVSNLQGSVASLQTLINTKAPIDSPVFQNQASLSNGAIPPSNDNSGRIPSTSWVRSYTATLSGDGFAQGTGIVFYQDTPPAGWALASNVDDYALRVDSDTAGTRVAGGRTFLEAFRGPCNTTNTAVSVTSASGLATTSTTVTINNRTGLSTNPHVLTIGEIPSHSHGIGLANGDDDNGLQYADSGEVDQFSGFMQTQSIGGGNGHSHTIPDHTHTAAPHTHTLSAHSHVSPIHDHDVNLNVRYANVMICIKS
jgi:hypothetical protein